MINTTERFNYYLDRFIQADTPEDKQKIIEEYTEVCFSDMEKELGNNLNGGLCNGDKTMSILWQ